MLAALSGVSLVDAVSADRQVTQTTAISPGGEVDITATNASLVIEVGTSDKVSVSDWMSVKSPTRSLARQALETFKRSSLSTHGSGVAVTIPTPEDFNLFAFSLDRQVTLKVPVDSPIVLRGQSVAADVHDLRGPLDLSVGSGAVRLKGVVVDGIDRVSTNAGAIDFEGSLESGSLDVQTESGAINLRLPAGTNASYDVATDHGAILIHPEHGNSTTLAGSNEAATGVLGSGGTTTIRLRASSGAIAVRVG